MMRYVLIVAAPFMLAIPAGGQSPVFRSGVDVVAVDVSVRSGNRPVTGLTSADFALSDNGQAQVVSDISYETMPIQITLIVDLSGSVKGPLLDSLTRSIDQIGRRLRPTDRVDLVTFNTRIREVSSSRMTTPLIAASLPTPQGPTSLLDAMVSALIRPRDPERRQMAIVFTDGADTDSFLDESTVQAVASRVDSAIFVVAVTGGTALSPEPPPHKKLFDNLTGLTGGQLAVLPRNRDLGDSFVRAFEEFRTSYVLRYTLKGARRPGWHEIGVRLTRPGRFDLRARRGYFVTAARGTS